MSTEVKSKLSGILGLKADFPVELVVFKTRSSFLNLAGSDLIAAFAVPARNLIVLDYSQARIHPLNMKGLLQHEMTHLILHNNIKEENLPKWLDEGVAEWASGGISEIIGYSPDVLKRAFLSGHMLQFNEISRSFPSDMNNVILAYEQGRSMVGFLERKYGKGSVKKLLVSLSRGMSFQDALKRNFSVTMPELEAIWKKDLKLRYTLAGYISDNFVWIIFIFGALVTIYGFIIIRKRIRDYPDDEAEEEEKGSNQV